MNIRNAALPALFLLAAACQVSVDKQSKANLANSADTLGATVGKAADAAETAIGKGADKVEETADRIDKGAKAGVARHRDTSDDTDTAAEKKRP